MTVRNPTSRWWTVTLLGAGIAVYACTDPTFDSQQPGLPGRPFFTPGHIIGPANVPRADRNDVPQPWTATNIALDTGRPYRITASGMLTFTDNPGYHTHPGCVPHPSYPSSVGPAGFDDQNRPWGVRAGMGTATTAPSSPLTWKPPLAASAPDVSALVKGPGTLWVSRPVVLPWSCGGPGFDEPGWFVSGSQQIQAVELEMPQVVPNKLSVPAGDTVLFTLQVSWSTSFFIGSGTGWRWVSDTTTSNSTLVSGCPRTQNTCRVVVREKGHVEVQNVNVEGMSFDARSPIVVVGTTACDPEVETMIREYETFNVNLHPTCPDFTNDGGSMSFTWSQLNGGFAQGNPHNPWGMVRTALTTGLDWTDITYSRGTIALTSGYRCPHGNAAAGGVQNSYHMHGRAGDMHSVDHPWTEDEFNLLKFSADQTGTIESLYWNSYADHHYHAAW